jgi:hypothetical protein
MMSKGIWLLCAVCWIMLCSLSLPLSGMHIHSFINSFTLNAKLINTCCLFKITKSEEFHIFSRHICTKCILLLMFLYKAWWWPSCAETRSWLLTWYSHTVNVLVLLVILLIKWKCINHKSEAYLKKNHVCLLLSRTALWLHNSDGINSCVKLKVETIQTAVPKLSIVPLQHLYPVLQIHT